MINPFEALAVALGIVYVILIMKRNRLGWIAGAASSTILAVLAAKSRLPMQSILQMAYVAIAVYGWWRWKPNAESQRVDVWSWRAHLAVLALCLGISLALARLPMMAATSDWPLLDSLVACLGLFASWLVARVYLENWLYWILIDALSIFLFIQQDLKFTSLLFVAYLVISCLGFRSWLRIYRQQPSPA